MHVGVGRGYDGGQDSHQKQGSRKNRHHLEGQKRGYEIRALDLGENRPPIDSDQESTHHKSQPPQHQHHGANLGEVCFASSRVHSNPHRRGQNDGADTQTNSNAVDVGRRVGTPDTGNGEETLFDGPQSVHDAGQSPCRADNHKAVGNQRSQNEQPIEEIQPSDAAKPCRYDVQDDNDGNDDASQPGGNHIS